ncbi:nucleotidyltransferase family protein [uncultured Tenacibaculum sp.]|uniref:nucleotidyltransferase family protein n=1 Tax=uncultured Tenacibaculum sp. TaxID=174713 RepID=UPI0026067A6A|nr:nucleotidyltransferase family protein [uncultured Tenacibaculum sp.]
MNYKDTLFFIGKCLTITHEEHNRILVEEKLKANEVNWDNVVKVSTSHYVFPALYCNLKRADFLHYLPNDLVEYMQHITDLNRERNEQIIAQAKEVNQLLLSHNITPIFLKGTGNLLSGLYEDIGERMLGDIDLLTSSKHFKPSIKILKENKYSENSRNFLDNTVQNRHYPKITKKGKIGALEVHYKMINNESSFNFNTIEPNLQKVMNNLTVLSFKDKTLITCLNKQLNDNGQWYKTISLRNSYDLYLLSKKTSVQNTLTNFESPYKDYLINFLASSNLIFNAPKSLNYLKTNKTEKFKKQQMLLIEYPKKASFNKRKWDLYFLYKIRFSIFFKALYITEYRKYFFKKLTKPNS